MNALKIVPLFLALLLVFSGCKQVCPIGSEPTESRFQATTVPSEPEGSLSMTTSGTDALTTQETTQTVAETSAAPLAATSPVDVMPAPPVLTLVAGEQSAAALQGGYTWTVLDGDEAQTVTACGLHPLECKDLVTPFVTNLSQLDLSFSVYPDNLTVTVWPDGAWGATNLEGMDAQVEDGSLEVYPGGYIYVVNATWNQDQGIGTGTAEYVFYVIGSEN